MKIRFLSLDDSRSRWCFLPAFARALGGRLLVIAAVLFLKCATSLADEPRYMQVNPSTEEGGTGKVYLGREIAQVMSHTGAGWLERPDREREEKTSKLIRILGLESGMRVADIGTGTGFIARKIARKIGETGLVLAVDIQPEMLALLKKRDEEAGVTNVEPVLGTAINPNLAANSIDLALMVDVYHEFSEPFEMMQNLNRTIKPGGRVVFVEFRAEDDSVPILARHKMTVTQLKKEMAQQSLEWEKTIDELPWQHVVIFRKPLGG